MAREYGEDLGNGMVRVVRENDDGTYTVVRTESMQENQGQSPAPVGGGQNLGAMRNGLQQAGYNGPWDDASVIAAYNRTVNGGNAGVGAGANSGFAGLWQALTGSNQQYFDQQNRQFDATNTLNQNTLLANLLQGLLGSSIQLANNPANWLDYANNISGGKNIFNIIKGNQPVPAFQQPGGFTANNSIQNLLAQLGLIQDQNNDPRAVAMSQATAPITGNTKPVGSSTLYTPDGMPEPQTPAIQDANRGDQSLFGVPVPQDIQRTSPAFMGPPVANQPAVEPAVTSPYNVPLPHQVNPAVWDSLSPVIQAMALASAQRGNTPSGYWNPEDYIAQLNAQRPMGKAPSQVRYDYKPPQGLFG